MTDVDKVGTLIIITPFAVGCAMIVLGLMMAVVGKIFKNREILEKAWAASCFGLFVACPFSFWLGVVALFACWISKASLWLFTLNEEE